MPTTAAARRSARRSPRLALAALAVLVPAVAGCGFDVQTNEVYQPAVGTDNRSETVDVLGAVVVSSEDGKGAFVATLVNNSDSVSDQLTDIAASDGVEVGTVPDDELSPQQPVDLADDGGVPLTGSKIETRTSPYLTLRLTFKASNPVTMRVPVVTATGPYSDLAQPSATPLPTPNDVASQGAGGVSPSGSATPGS